MTRERPFVQRASTYRVRERDPLCALCGEAIRVWHGSHIENVEWVGDVPVHDDCSNDTERQHGDPR